MLIAKTAVSGWGLWMKDKMTVTEAAAALNVWPQKVRYWLKHGHMRGETYGRLWLIEPEEVERIKRVGPPKRGVKAGQPQWWRKRPLVSPETSAAESALVR